jgi:hypothetical protein
MSRMMRITSTFLIFQRRFDANDAILIAIL